MGGSPLTAARLQRAAHPEQPIDQHKMRQDQGRAWRGACKTFATLAAEIRICVNVSTASKTRMKDLTMACRESGHSFPRPHRLELESQLPGSCQDMGICSEGFKHIRGSRKSLRLTASFSGNAGPRSRSQQPSTPQPVLGLGRAQEISSTEVPQEHCLCKAETQSCF